MCPEKSAGRPSTLSDCVDCDHASNSTLTSIQRSTARLNPGWWALPVSIGAGRFAVILKCPLTDACRARELGDREAPCNTGYHGTLCAERCAGLESAGN